MKVIIAGSRTIHEYALVEAAVQESGFAVSEVVSGGARGVDSLGAMWAIENSVLCSVFLADWEEHGKAAGPIRNQEMAAYGEALIAVWDGSSRGTAHMIAAMRRLGKPVYVKEVA